MERPAAFILAHPRGSLSNCLIALLFIMMLPAAASGAAYVVHPDGSGDLPTIQAALDVAANQGDTILLTDGSFTGPGNRDLNLQSKSLTLRSLTGNPESCIIDLEGYAAGYLYHPYTFPPVVIEQITFRDGDRLRCDAVVEVRGCVFEEMSEGIYGGEFSRVEVHDCLFTGGTGWQILGDVDVYGCDFSENLTEIAWGSLLLFEDCVFSDNISDTSLIIGESFMYSGSLVLRGCQFLRNTAGSALVSTIGSFGSHGATFAGNSGPCIAVQSFSNPHPSIGVFASTFVGNSGSETSDLLIDAGGDGPEVTIDSSIFAFSEMGSPVTCNGPVAIELSCCDIYGNEGGDWIGQIADQFGVSGNISEDPLFCYGVAESPYMLQDGSPCAPFSPPNEECDQIGAWPVGCSPAEIEETEIGSSTKRIRSVPNPFRSFTRIFVPDQITSDPEARFQIISSSGRVLLEIPLDRQVYAGSGLIWDGTDRSGRRLPSGVYFYRVSGAVGSKPEPIVLTR